MSNAPFPIRSIQVDGGSEFRSVFEAECQARGLELFVLPPKRPDLTVVSNAPQSTWRYEFYATYALPAHIDKLQPFVAPSAIDSTIIGRTTPLPDKPRQSISKLSAKGDDRLSYVVSLGTALPRKLEECHSVRGNRSDAAGC